MDKVKKFGGSSIADDEQIYKIAEEIKQNFGKFKQVIVLSARGKTTNQLLSICDVFGNQKSGREVDQLLATGEIQSVSLLCIRLNEIGVPAISMSGLQAGIRTTSDYGSAKIISIDIEKLKKYLNDGFVVVVAGFQGVDEFDNITTLGRGGSDTTAVALASVLGYDCEIFTDVSGVFRMDPALCPEAKKIPLVDYDEMLEMASGGAKVLEVRCVEIAKKYGTEIYIGKALDSKMEGTVVGNKVDIIENMPITNVSVKDDIALFDIRYSSKEACTICNIVSIIDNAKIPFKMFNQTIDEMGFIVRFCVANDRSDELLSKLKELGESVKCVVNNDVAKVTMVGIGFATHTEIAKKVFEILYLNDIECKNIDISQLTMSFIIDKKYAKSIAKILGKEFDL